MEIKIDINDNVIAVTSEGEKQLYYRDVHKKGFDLSTLKNGDVISVIFPEETSASIIVVKGEMNSFYKMKFHAAIINDRFYVDGEVEANFRTAGIKPANEIECKKIKQAAANDGYKFDRKQKKVVKNNYVREEPEIGDWVMVWNDCPERCIVGVLTRRDKNRYYIDNSMYAQWKNAVKWDKTFDHLLFVRSKNYK